MTYKNTNMQGNAGIGAAIAYFTANSYTVSIPLTDTQDYDLIVDNGAEISRIQVKSTTYKDGNNYFVSLTVKGGNRSGTGKIKKFNASKVDGVFIITGDRMCYLIPSSAIVDHSSITLAKKYDKFRVTDALTGVGTGPACNAGASTC